MALSCSLFISSACLLASSSNLLFSSSNLFMVSSLSSYLAAFSAVSLAPFSDSAFFLASSTSNLPAEALSSSSRCQRHIVPMTLLATSLSSGAQLDRYIQAVPKSMGAVRPQRQCTLSP
ncbi:hypothetical protein BJ878DRAFT_523032 [Calycina marina]|uniref:Uncharacterized protein n=1 Tax=Calycina marina TaxID=1763456 RepID=A0A9P8CBI0_9HELO|nr:hypothetical protein BJ878DRAFT_523032 [Calycina marina]